MGSHSSVVRALVAQASDMGCILSDFHLFHCKMASLLYGFSPPGVQEGDPSGSGTVLARDGRSHVSLHSTQDMIPHATVIPHASWSDITITLVDMF